MSGYWLGERTMHASGKHVTPRGATFTCFAALGGGSARYRILAEACVYGDVVCATCAMGVDRALPSWTGWRGAAIRFARSESLTITLWAAHSGPADLDPCFFAPCYAHPQKPPEQFFVAAGFQVFAAKFNSFPSFTRPFLRAILALPPHRTPIL